MVAVSLKKKKNTLFNIAVFCKKAFDDCRYGYVKLRKDYARDSIECINRHQWLFNKDSKDYIDMENQFTVASISIKNARKRLHQILDESKQLQESIKNYLAIDK